MGCVWVGWDDGLCVDRWVVSRLGGSIGCVWVGWVDGLCLKARSHCTLKACLHTGYII